MINRESIMNTEKLILFTHYKHMDIFQRMGGAHAFHPLPLMLSC